MSRGLSTRWVVAAALAVPASPLPPLLSPTGHRRPRTPGARRVGHDRRRGQGSKVKLWMWGGEDALNRYIDDDVVPPPRHRA